MRAALLGIAALAASAAARQRRYNTAPNLAANPSIKVHLVPHSHDDVGWLKTAAQYAFGLNNS